jgi:hypothetical protein
MSATDEDAEFKPISECRSMKECDSEMEKAKALAATLTRKSLAEAVGTLMLTFEGMTLISAKALMLCVDR